MTSEPIAVELTGITDCDLCEDHFCWDCPACGRAHDHYQVPASALPEDVPCACGAVNRITVEAAAAWRARFGVA